MKIGLSFADTDDQHNNYMQWLKSYGEIEVITLCSKEADKQLVDDCDGLVLSGGVDIHPQFYGGDAKYPFMPPSFDVERDEFELSLVRSAAKNAIPVLGICRGLQLINVFYGGTLVQNISEVGVFHEGSPDKKHVVNVDETTLLHKISGIKSAEVNSSHHQCVDRLGHGLTANCKSEDGIIEGIELTDKTDSPFILCVQWHPERMKEIKLQHSPLSKNVLHCFINEAILNTRKKSR